MVNIGFAHGESKNNLFFSYAFKQTKEQILLQVQHLKIIIKNLLLLGKSII